MKNMDKIFVYYDGGIIAFEDSEFDFARGKISKSNENFYSYLTTLFSIKKLKMKVSREDVVQNIIKGMNNTNLKVVIEFLIRYNNIDISREIINYLDINNHDKFVSLFKKKRSVITDFVISSLNKEFIKLIGFS